MNKNLRFGQDTYNDGAGESEVSLNDRSELSKVQNTSCYTKLRAEENQLRRIFMKIKRNRIRDAFMEKAMRTIDTDDEAMLKEWRKEQETSMPSVQGFIANQAFLHVMELLNILCFPILLLLTSFIGFLDDFATNFPNNPIVINLKVACLIVLIMRIWVKSTTETFSEGQFKRYLSEIIIAYFKSTRLVFDLILFVLQILNLVLPQNMMIAGILFFYLNLMMIYPGNDTIRTQAAYIQNRRINLIWTLLKIVFFNIFFAHFMATILLGMARLQPQISWLVRAGIQDSTWYIKYIHAYYWGTTIMMTVGFGDILPGEKNWKEMLITSFVQLFSCIVLGYNVSSIGNIVQKLREAEETVNRKVVIFQRMMQRDRNKNVFINKFLEKRISNYLQELRIDRSNMFHIEKDQLLSQLPENLRRAYFKQANRRIFSSVKFFTQLKPKTLQILAQKFRCRCFNPGQNLPSQSQILILQDGQIGLTYKKRGATRTGRIQQIIVVNQYQNTVLVSGKSLFDFKESCKYGMVAKVDSIVWCLHKEVFLELISASAIDFQYFFSLMHKHSVIPSQWEFVTCERCSHMEEKDKPKSEGNNYLYETRHTRFDCSRLTYMPIRSLIISRNLSTAHSPQQPRVLQFQRHKSTLTSKSTMSWRRQFAGNLEQVQKSISMTKKNSVSLHSNRSSHRSSYRSGHIMSGIQEEEEIESKLKRIMREVMLEAEIGYEEEFWSLGSDAVHDYQWYFPQDNANRLHYVPIKIHPRQTTLYDQDKLKFRIKSIAQTSRLGDRDH